MGLEIEPIINVLQERKLQETHLDLRALGVETLEDWVRVGRTLGRLGTASRWWMGDWIIYGEGAFGEEYAQFVDELGVTEETLMRYARVSRAWPVELRRPGIPYTVFELCRNVPNELKAGVLDKYLHEGWNRADLIAFLREHGWTQVGLPHRGKTVPTSEVSVFQPEAALPRPSEWPEDEEDEDAEKAEEAVDEDFVEAKVVSYGECPLCQRPFRSQEEWEEYRLRLRRYA
jgi:hypothetical protein